jgi:hypothetical protein
MEPVHDVDDALRATGGNPVPTLDRRDLEEALRTTLAALDKASPGQRIRSRRWRRRASRASHPVARSGALAQPANRARAADVSSNRVGRAGAWLIVAAVAVTIALGTAMLASCGGRPSPVTSTAASVAPSRPLELTDDERAALEAALTVTEELDRIVAAGVPFRAYFNHASSAHAEAGRHLDEVKDGEPKQLLQQALGLHRLAAGAWRARTVNEHDAWEQIGRDPAAQLCATVRRVLGSGDEPAGMSRAQWRGMVIAATIPLVWDCAAERVTQARLMLGVADRRHPDQAVTNAK